MVSVARLTFTAYCRPACSRNANVGPPIELAHGWFTCFTRFSTVLIRETLPKLTQSLHLCLPLFPSPPFTIIVLSFAHSQDVAELSAVCGISETPPLHPASYHAEALRHGEHHLAPRDYPGHLAREAVSIHLASSVCALSLIDPCDGSTLGPRISAYWGSSPLILPTRVCIGSGIAMGNPCPRIMSQTEPESGVWEVSASGE